MSSQTLIELIELLQQSQCLSKDVWKENVEVLKTFYNNLRQTHYQRWMAWDSDVVRLLCETIQYTKSTREENEAVEICGGKINFNMGNNCQCE